ncbi:zinc finger protein 862-like [Argopecten irradians]|uniref:zinc finger protein 862-like n=1 Tax=Argopecten irradians TaxID=31199 RepID=UPI00371A0CF1
MEEERKDIILNSDMGAKVIDVLHLIYKTYHYSPKFKRKIQTLADNLQVRIKTPSRVKGTRWSPHTEKALKNLLLPPQGKTNQDVGQYCIVHQHMEHLAESSANAEIKGRAKHLTKIMKSFNFLAYCHLLLDILKVISSLSFSLQTNKTILTTATSAIRSCMTDLTTMKTLPLPNGALVDLIGFLKSQNADQHTFQTVVLGGVPEIAADDDESTYDNFSFGFRRNCVTEPLSLVVDGMKKRYRSIVGEDDHDEPSKIVKALKVFHHDSWPENDLDLALYGNEAVTSLVAWFEDILLRNGCKTPAVLPEWKRMKVLSTRHDLIMGVVPDKGAIRHRQNFLMLVKIMLCLPVSSAKCERTFSTMNRIKTDVRSSLNITTLEDLIRISGEGPDILGFDPNSAVQKWLSTSRKVKLNYVGWPENCEDDD